jgi:hypothetical protein
MEYRHPNTASELFEQAGLALAKRDPQRLEELQQISAEWLQMPYEASAQMTALHAMTEAADLLIDEPSDLGWED